VKKLGRLDGFDRWLLLQDLEAYFEFLQKRRGGCGSFTGTNLVSRLGRRWSTLGSALLGTKGNMQLLGFWILAMSKKKAQRTNLLARQDIF